MITTSFVSYEIYKNFLIEIRPHREGYLWAISILLISGTAPTLSEAKVSAIDYLEESEFDSW